MIVCVKDGQCLVDIALMMTGATEGVWALALRNGLSVTATIEHGTEIAWEGEDIKDALTVRRYQTEGICPATEISSRALWELLHTEIVTAKPPHEDIATDDVVPQSTRASVFTQEFTVAFS